MDVLNPGKMISIEGVEGVGKSTLIPLVAQEVKAEGYSVVMTREPGGTEIGERVRDLLLHEHDSNIAPVTELSLMFAARAQHLEEVIKPALNKGCWVICDRFTDSTYAYQGGGRQLDQTLIESIEVATINAFQPDHTLLLDLDVELGYNVRPKPALKTDLNLRTSRFLSESDSHIWSEPINSVVYTSFQLRPP